MSRGGSRWGAGRPGKRVKAEYLQRVDVREWARRGRLNGAGSFSWSWHRGGEPSGSIGVWVDSPDTLTFRYALTVNGEQQSIAQRVNLTRTPCTYGGIRRWFSCPSCARRVALLYLRGGRFACRQCQRVAYASQSEDGLDRMWRKQSKMEALLGHCWARPKGMRAKTYERVVSAIQRLEERREALLMDCISRLGLLLP